MKLKCPYCHIQRDPMDASRTIRHWGSYFRKSDGQRLTRLWCFPCQKSFSAASLSPLSGQKKRKLNRIVKKLMTAGVSQREAARVLGINVKTVVRKFRFAGKTALNILNEENLKHPKAKEVEFDDLETFEHTKLKPLSVPLMVEFKSRRILAFEVCQMPAKGKLAPLSRKKYGPRADHRAKARDKLFDSVHDLVEADAVIRSDSNPHYPATVRRHFPKATHVTVLGGRAAVVGQGELKKLKFDPIFSLNHTCAMFRAHINRLIRKTWCTTKRPDQLAIHIAIYAVEHNRRLATG